MGILDTLKGLLSSEAKKAANDALNKAVSNIGKGKNRDVKFTFAKIPTSVEELKAIPEANLDSPFKTTALTILVLANFENDNEATFEMLNYLKGPEPLSTMEKKFITERLIDRQYIVSSFFKGSSPENDYTPTQPYTIVATENPYTFDTENWGMMLVTSSGADSQRFIKVRKKPSTGQWFLNDIQCLAGIRVPVSQNKWA